ncbi:MAG: Fe(2+)-dependent GTP cyclohydrolase MptA [Candidatus Methanohalarchaeum thermophilum]|uniref:GTP cyclohydrolase MptA n=1 Tax=Methanohalarchaeum thermophilum TaxID=1903181 RepID=A0A1Q6DVF4_METT1|nr:MAG: Fe(2+)-dependent GTP cyclohydrolase MptA [Candidatus Methanohalarchaeum thermophilum]
MDLPDVQANEPDINVGLDKVGVSKIKKQIKLAREGSRDPVILNSEFEISVDLPSDRKGANLSRNFEAINEVLEKAIDEPVYEIEGLCIAVAEELMNKHEYASRAIVTMESEVALEKNAPVSGLASQNVTKIFAEAVVDDKGATNEVGAEVTGTTACPCAQEIMAEKITDKLKEHGLSESKAIDVVKDIPIPTHNQRGRGFLSIKTSPNINIPIESLIDIINDSMSSEIFELLKREDEAYVTDKIHSNPVFVEDTVRKMILKSLQKFPNLPKDAVIEARQVNKESIHNHDVFAQKKEKVANLKKDFSELS